jgi:tetratricopeptide (TPR) repeat protein
MSLHRIHIHRRANTLAIALAATLSLCGNALAVPDAQFQPAFSQFEQAAQGKESAIEKSAEAFTALLAQEPTNPVLMAYAGAATSMRATTTMLPWKKMGFAEDGLAQLDKALSMLTAAHNAPLQQNVPATLVVRYVAANTFLSVPGFMNRGARGAKLMAEVLASPLLDSAPLAFRGEVWLKAAEFAAKDKRTGEARKHLQRVIDSNAPQAAAARTQLQALAS